MLESSEQSWVKNQWFIRVHMSECEPSGGHTRGEGLERPVGTENIPAGGLEAFEQIQLLFIGHLESSSKALG